MGRRCLLLWLLLHLDGVWAGCDHEKCQSGEVSGVPSGYYKVREDKSKRECDRLCSWCRCRETNCRCEKKGDCSKLKVCRCSHGKGARGRSCPGNNHHRCSSCDSGYKLSNGRCVDVDECAAGLDHCGPNSNCVNTVGSKRCDCKDGFLAEIRPTGKACVDIDECAGDHGCHANATCTNTKGSYTCVCNSGYEGNGVQCTDVDECTSGSHGCDDNADCTNFNGFHACICHQGYKGDGKSCVDINECNLPQFPCLPVVGVCTNTPGSYKCSCKDGYHGEQCVDVDECSGTHACHTNAECTNTIGSYDCQCLDGYEGNGVQCADVNECTRGNHDCDAHARCTNFVGSYRCACKDGYSGDGKTCRPCGRCAQCSAGHAETRCFFEDGNRLCTAHDAPGQCQCRPYRYREEGHGFCVNQQGDRVASYSILLEDSLELCLGQCSRQTRCTGASFMPERRQCHLHEELPLQPPHEAVYSGFSCFVPIRNSAQWPLLALSAHHYIGCFLAQPDRIGRRDTAIDSGTSRTSQTCARHCRQYQYFALWAVVQNGRTVNACTCADQMAYRYANVSRVDDAKCHLCQGETHRCGIQQFMAFYRTPLPLDGDDCPDGTSRKDESSYGYVSGIPSAKHTLLTLNTPSCSQCASACDRARYSGEGYCHAFRCDPVGEAGYSCSLFDFPVPEASQNRTTGHLCALRSCDAITTACEQGYKRMPGVATLGGTNSKVRCTECAEQCQNDACCLAYQCSPTVDACTLFSSRNVSSGVSISDVTLCARIPEPRCVWTTGSLASDEDCRCGPHEEICLAGTRCWIDDLTWTSKCLVGTDAARVAASVPTCDKDAECPCHMSTCAPNHLCMDCISPGCPEVLAPVCGSDNTTYDNSCYALCNGTEVAQLGSCAETPLSCPETFTTRDLFCGSDGRTYLNWCFLQAAGITTASEGMCKPACSTGSTDCICGEDFCEIGESKDSGMLCPANGVHLGCNSTDATKWTKMQ